MVKRYDLVTSRNSRPYVDTWIDEIPNQGNYVTYADYRALQAALCEALDRWEFSATEPEYRQGERDPRRISELRKFLDDK